MILAIYTSYGWEVPIADAADHIGEAFAGGYWTGRPPPVPLTELPANAVIDMRSGEILAATSEIGDPADFLSYVTQANAD